MPTRAPRSSISRGDPTATYLSARASISAWATSSPALRASARWRRSSSAGPNWSWPCRQDLFAGGSGLGSGPLKSFLSRSLTRNDLPFVAAMSALGQKRTSRPLEGTSASPPKVDIGTQSGIVRFVPKADILPAVLSVELIVQPDAHDVVGEIGVCVF